MFLRSSRGRLGGVMPTDDWLLSSSRQNVGVDARWRMLAIGVAGFAFLLRVAYSIQVELLPEEAYYWNYSQHLDIGYLDHPPMVAWLIRIGTTLFGDTEFGVRCGALCCGLAAAFFVYRLTRNLFGEPSASLALMISQSLPFFFLSGILMTPDAPLTAAWAASLYFLERALIGGHQRAWIWAGLSLGAGFISKYTIGLVGVSVFLFMLLDQPSRHWFRRWQPYAALIIAAAVFLPVIVWNAEHDWASFAFQTARRLAERPRFSLHRLVESALVLLTPTGLLAAGITLRGQPRELPDVADASQGSRAWRFMQLAVWVPVAVFALFSLRHEVKLDWTGAPWVAALPLMAAGVAATRGQRTGARSWLAAAWPPTIVIMFLIYCTGLYYLVLGIPGVGYTQHTELVPVEWRDLARQIDGAAGAARVKYGDNLLIVGMDRYAIASELAFYSQNQTRAVAQTSSGHLFEGMGLMYEQWFPIAKQAGRPLLLVAWEQADLTPGRLGNRVQGLEPMQESTLARHGMLVRRFYYRAASGYRYP